MLSYSPRHKLFVWRGSFESRQIPQQAGFVWHKAGKAWVTPVSYAAYLLYEYANKAAREQLQPLAYNIESSQQPDDSWCMKDYDLPYLPYQKAGIEHMVDQFAQGRKAVMLADEQGLGKTIQAIGVANELRLKKLLVICPASLRLNWAREIDRWHTLNDGVDVHLNGQMSDNNLSHSQVTSYELAKHLKDYKPEIIIIDEAHYIKNRETQRTKLILGSAVQKWPGLVSDTPTVFLTGTPIPNRPIEFWPLLYRTASDVITKMTYWQFARRFHYIEADEYGTSFGPAKRQNELYVRLRGSGFMVRRLKKDVLKDLPPKRYKMVVFPATGETSKVLHKEANFNAREIAEHGVPVGSALPEIRREMGIAKIPQAAEYISAMLNSGVQKIVVFCHHIEVAGLLEEKLREFCPMVITGSTPPAKRQGYVDAFQTDPRVQVLIGNIQAAGVGITLTEAHDVVFVEASWVPGENDQAADRCHRIGQNESVLIHFLVVERSLDAKILGSAAKKKTDIDEVLDGN